ncbi:MAG: PP2C family protein-serine/threonine phosphatase [Ignavibacteria bacterium]|nr:PP2C family protein-serine/threonine phosphatase [Ignavibacteria bacterium]
MDNTDTVHKQLELNALIEFAQLISSKLDLKYILNNILLSNMGKMLISKGMILLKSDDNNENIYSIAAAKGIDQKYLNTDLSVIFPKYSVFNLEDMEDQNDFIKNCGFQYFFKIYFQNKYLGILCFGKKFNNLDLNKNEIIYIETMLHISASAIENTIKFNEVNTLNLNLNNKIRQLKSLFELGKEFNSNFTNKDTIIKLLSYTLLGNFGIKDFIIFSRDKNDKFYLLKENKNIDLSQLSLNDVISDDNVKTDFKSTILIDKDSDIPFISYLYERGFELLIPTIIKNKIENLICLGKKLNRTAYSATDIEFLESIINLSLISIQNSNLFQEYVDKLKIENELKIAREIQLAMLPSKIPEVNGYDITGMNLPALQVGGDYYDVIKLTETKTALIIADVSGKGTPASLLMANIQSAVHSYLKLYEEGSFSLVKVTEKINELIYENTASDKFITFFWGILDSENNTFEYINAGHNPPVLLKKDKLIMLNEGGFMIGIIDVGINYEVGKVGIDKDDVIVFYTDGVTEANDSEGMEFGEKRLYDIIIKYKNNSSVMILEEIKHSIKDFTKDTAQYDDITMIVLKKN